MVHSRTIGFLLNSLKDLEAISMRVKRIAALQKAFVDAAPKDLTQWSRVGSETQGILVLLADNGAVAARLRQSAPRLLAAIRKRWPEVTAIRIEVQVVQNSKVKNRQKRRVGTTGLEDLRQLAGALPDSALRTAIVNLIAHQAAESELKSENQPFQRKESQNYEGDEQRVFEHLPSETQPASVPSEQEQHDGGPDDNQDQKTDNP
jgi:hypothetical protein